MEMNFSLNLTGYLQDQSIEETIEVLDEVLTILVVHTEYIGVWDNLSHQYLTIKALRELFVKLATRT